MVTSQIFMHVYQKTTHLGHRATRAAMTAQPSDKIQQSTRNFEVNLRSPVSSKHQNQVSCQKTCSNCEPGLRA